MVTKYILAYGGVSSGATFSRPNIRPQTPPARRKGGVRLDQVVMGIVVVAAAVLSVVPAAVPAVSTGGGAEVESRDRGGNNSCTAFHLPR